ncbi:uncharacterized protein LOC106168376 [Lingula anatina]|uniref:Uncharacterized protein LOC106168376 n=1 Tax=Lingula anatina TaxID=7574 RepID=A0A1S3IY03_LINAN|nr:uncharacterized protein LOC106168376 [Lingula anatina]|eukprot:XP_013402866.2 uncharacterized protein LOC106168376 [Lingula anatina]
MFGVTPSVTGTVVFNRSATLTLVFHWCLVKALTMAAALTSIIRVFLVGDVMIGRGIDQILPYHCKPWMYRDFRNDSREYAQLAIDKNGPLPKEIGMDYVWGDALQILQEKQPDFRLINLETAITTSETAWLGKRVQYRTHPRHVETLQAAGVDCCVLSNNHVLDWGYPGLAETLTTLKKANMKYVGAGENIFEAQKPAIFEIPNKGRIVVFGACHTSGLVNEEWNATETKSGVNLLSFEDIPYVVKQLADQVKKVEKPGDIVILSIHWGPNYKWLSSPMEREFAHAAIDVAGVDVIHGHSSHHVKGIEVYNGKLIMYGCGDIVSDYEGTPTPLHKRPFHNVRSLMYFADIDPLTGEVVDFKMIPTMMKNLRVNRADEEASSWLYAKMSELCEELGGGVQWDGSELRLVLQSGGTTHFFTQGIGWTGSAKCTIILILLIFVLTIIACKSCIFRKVVNLHKCR